MFKDLLALLIREPGTEIRFCSRKFNKELLFEAEIIGKGGVTFTTRSESELFNRVEYFILTGRECGPPGSLFATDNGCVCPVMDNHHGAGLGNGQYIYTQGCRVHDYKMA